MPAPLRSRLLVAVVVGAVCCMFGWSVTVAAQPAGAHQDTLEAADYEAMYKVPPPQLGKNTAATAQIVVEYVGFPAEAQAAFQYAVDIWETHVSSPVPLYMVAQWADLGEGTLGSAGPTTFFGAEPFLPRDDAWYALPLVHALAGERLLRPEGGECFGGQLPTVQGECPDMVATFNSELDIDGDGDLDWSFEPNPAPSEIRGEYHLATVVLHEIGHGLGFLDSFNYDDGIAASDNPDECADGGTGTGCWGYGSSDGSVFFPTIFDLYVEDEDEDLLINTNVYPNPSVALGRQLRSEEVFFAGEAVRRVNTDVPADLYAPVNFEPGSSTAHFDEETFNNTANALMTPQLARSEIILSPGPLTCALMFDIGWPLGPGCEAFIQPQLLVFDAMTVDGAAVVTWEVAEDAALDRFVVERSDLTDCEYTACIADADDLSFVPIDTIAATAERSYRSTIDADVLPGRYLLRLRLIGEEGDARLSEPREVFFEVGDEPIVTSVYPNPFVDGAEVNVVLNEEEQVEVRVYNSIGRLVARLFDGTVPANERTRIRFPASSLPAGIYFIQVEGESFMETLESVKL